ncbi:MAG: beta strand repeat-containing protein [Planctomycetota bacterium]|jgi:filamentous hemagglutinin family protein
MKRTLLSGRRIALLAAAATMTLAASGPARAQVAPVNLDGLNWDPGTMTFDTFLANAWADMATFNWGALETVTITSMNGLGRRVLFNVDPANGATTIAGTLAAGNHFVYIANPAGVNLNGTINVGGLYAVAGAPTFLKGDFLSGSLNDTYQFDTSAGGVMTVGNAATITAAGGNGVAPMVHLLGSRVNNQGAIVLTGADAVVTMLADQTSITLTELANGRVSVRLDGTDITDANGVANANVANGALDLVSTAGVEHTGSVQAQGLGSMAQVVLGAGDMYALAIDNNGVINGGTGSVQMTGLNGTVWHRGAQLTAGTLAADGSQIQLDANVNADTAVFGNVTKIGNDITIEGQAGGGAAATMISFESLLDGTAGAEQLTLNSAATNLLGNVGATTTLGQLQVTGTALVGGNITTAGNIMFGGDVVFAAAGIGGNQAVDAGAGSIDMDGSAGKITLGSLTFSGAGGISLAGSATTSNGNLVFNNDLTLDAAGIGSNQMLDAGGAGALDLNAHVTKTTAGSLTMMGATGVSLGGNASTANGDLVVNGDLALDAAGIGGNQTLDAGGGALDLNGHVTKTTLGQITLNGPESGRASCRAATRRPRTAISP